MATTITTTIAKSVYEHASANPITIASSGAILGNNAYYALSLAPGVTWSVLNEGTISGGVGDGLDATLAAVTNTGLIAGADYGLHLLGDSSPADTVIVNSGTITESSATAYPWYDGAVYLWGAGRITNQAGGLISGAGNGVMTYHLGTHPDTITNAGRIAGGSYGISSGGNLTLVNGGIITGGSAGVVSADLGSTGHGQNDLTNAAGGVIEGGTYGVLLTGGGTLVNAGTISGAAAAVLFRAGGTDRLIDEPGAVFDGKVGGGNAIGSGTVSTLELASASAAGTLSGLGAGTGFYDFAAVTVDTGANWSLTGADTLAAGATLADGGNLTLASALAGTGTIAFAATGLTLTVGKGDAPAPALAGFKGNTVALLGVHETISGYAGGRLTLGGASAITLAIAGSYSAASFSAVYANGETLLTACYAAGTAIETEHGPVAVEHLRAGMRLRTASGALRALRWLGHRRHAGAEVAAHDELRPVRIAARALGDGLPRRDLRLSPEHALLLGGVLIPAIQLLGVPGIEQEQAGEVVYYHVELDSHDAILAEGVAAETYIEEAGGTASPITGFDNAGTRPAPPATTRCAPRIASGPVLAAIRRRLGAPEAGHAAGGVIGNIESTAPGRIGGWAFQPAAPDAPVRLLVAADGVPCGSAIANGFRFDLRRAGLGGGQAAFLYTGPIPAGARSVSVTRASDGAHLPGSPFVLPA